MLATLERTALEVIDQLDQTILLLDDLDAFGAVEDAEGCSQRITVVLEPCMERCNVELAEHLVELSIAECIDLEAAHVDRLVDEGAIDFPPVNCGH